MDANRVSAPFSHGHHGTTVGPHFSPSEMDIAVSVPAGWFPDESSPGRDRYWDGLKWTDETRDSATTGLKPPPPSHADSSSSAEEADDSQVLKLSPEQFRNVISHLADRKRTYQALIIAHEVENELCTRARDVEVSAGIGMSPTAMLTIIEGFEDFYANVRMPAVENLGASMQADFDDVVKEIGGPLLLPVPMEQAWENFVRPVKAIALQIENEVRPYLEAFTRVQARYS